MRLEKKMVLAKGKKESFLYHFWLTRLTPKALVAYFQGGPLTFPKLVACTHELSLLAYGYYKACKPSQAAAVRPGPGSNLDRRGWVKSRER